MSDNWTTENPKSKISSWWPRADEWWPAFASFPRRQKIGLLLIALVGLVCFVWGIVLLNRLFTLTVAASGGELTEGAIGSVNAINPLFAIADVNKDLVTLIYSGLVRPGVKPGEYIPDLAESYTISPDGLTYTFKLRPNLTWQDGQPLTVDDIIFTITKVQDPALKSPKRAAWDGVKAEKIDDETLRLTLKQPYAGFLDTATLGILPKHLWTNVSTQEFTLHPLNLIGVGSGPYAIESVRRDSNNKITGYDLIAFDNFALGSPRLRRFHFLLYPTEDGLLAAYRSGEIEAASSLEPAAADYLQAQTANSAPVLTRVFAIFFNPSQSPVLAEPEVRTALNLAVDRERLVAEVLRGYGLPLSTPIIDPTAPSSNLTADPAAARSLLLKNGWAPGSDGILVKKIKKDTVPLSITITTTNLPELKATAELIKADWQAIGADVTVELFESGDLNQVVIQPRKFQALLFGQSLGREPDWFAFWHSSQRLYPGSNITGYTSLAVDKAVEDLRRLTDPVARAKRLQDFLDNLAKDRPAVFLYAPRLVYLLPTDVHGLSPAPITTPADRFLHIYNWYRQTRRVWLPFARPEDIIKN